MPDTRGERQLAKPRALGATPSLWSWHVLAALVSPANSFRRDKAIIHHSLAPAPCHAKYQIHPMDPCDTGLCITQIHAAWAGTPL